MSYATVLKTYKIALTEQTRIKKQITEKKKELMNRYKEQVNQIKQEQQTLLAEPGLRTIKSIKQDTREQIKNLKEQRIKDIVQLTTQIEQIVNQSKELFQ